LDNLFNSFILTRKSKIYDEVLTNSSEYLEVKSKETQQYKQLKKDIDIERLIKFTDIRDDMQCVSNDIFYRQGMKDSIKIIRLLLALTIC